MVQILETIQILRKYNIKIIEVLISTLELASFFREEKLYFNEMVKYIIFFFLQNRKV